jgi:hypothetical protein
MKRWQREFAWAVLGLLLVAAGGASLYHANDWWLSGVMTASVVAWLTGVLAAIYSPAPSRPAIIGAVVAGFLYVLLALGPWFRVHVGPWLLSSQAMVHIESNWLDRQPQVQQQLAFTTVNSPYNYVVTGSGTVTGSGVVTWPQVLTGSTLAVVGAPGNIASPMIVTGHWLCGWLAAGVGAVVAGWIARRSAASVKAKPEDKP